MPKEARNEYLTISDKMNKNHLDLFHFFEFLYSSSSKSSLNSSYKGFGSSSFLFFVQNIADLLYKNVFWRKRASRF